jgi:hypothetical protein
MIRRLTSAEQRAAQAALTRLHDTDPSFDRYLLIDDTDDVHSEIVTVLRERAPRALEVLS